MEDKRITITIPKDLMKYFDYLPDRELSEVVVLLMKDGLQSRLKPKIVDEGILDALVNKLMCIPTISKVATLSEQTPVVECSSEEVSIQEAVYASAVNEEQMLGTDEELDDFADLVK